MTDATVLTDDREPSSDVARPAHTPSGVKVSFAGVSKIFDTRAKYHVAVEDINLQIHDGEFVAIIGPSGCGKSTLLNMTAGVLSPSAGVVEYDGKTVSSINNDVGYVTQRDTLLPWRTVERNISLPLELQHTPRADRKERVAKILELVGLVGAAKQYPSQLSGGMQKRLALAQTLVYDPSMLLMDEPFGALDAQLRLVMQRELLSIWERSQKTVMFVTHDLEEAILLADRVVVFGANPGRIIHVEEIEFERPRDLVHLRGDPRFGAVWERLWGLLAQQMEEE